MHMVVDVLAGDDWQNRVCVLAIHMEDLILELGSLLREMVFNALVVPVIEVSVLDGSKLVGVLLWEDFPVLDGLY